MLIFRQKNDNTLSIPNWVDKKTILVYWVDKDGNI